MAIDLRNHRTLDLVIGQIFDEGLWCKESGLDIDKLGKRNIRAAVLGRDKTKEASVTPSIGERPIIGLSIFCQKFMISSRQDTIGSLTPSNGTVRP